MPVGEGILAITGTQDSPASYFVCKHVGGSVDSGSVSNTFLSCIDLHGDTPCWIFLDGWVDLKSTSWAGFGHVMIALPT